MNEIVCPHCGNDDPTMIMFVSTNKKVDKYFCESCAREWTVRHDEGRKAK